MILCVVLVVAQFAAAFLVLDLAFRWMDVTAASLPGRLRVYARRYAAIGAVVCALTLVAQWRLAGRWGAALAPLDAAPWWLLWRFGLRKQLTFLYRADGGRPLDGKNPDL